MTATATRTSASATVGTMKVRTLKDRAASPRASVAFSVLDLVVGLRQAAQSALAHLRGRGQDTLGVAIPSATATR